MFLLGETQNTNVIKYLDTDNEKTDHIFLLKYNILWAEIIKWYDTKYRYIRVTDKNRNFLDFDSLAAPCLFQGLAWSSMTSQKASQNRYK